MTKRYHRLLVSHDCPSAISEICVCFNAPNEFISARDYIVPWRIKVYEVEPTSPPPMSAEECIAEIEKLMGEMDWPTDGLIQNVICRYREAKPQ